MKHNAGFTLIEVLIATFILGVAIVGILWLANTTHSGVRATLGEIEASNLASQIVETFQALPFDSIPCVDGPLPDALPQAFYDKIQQAGYKIKLPVIPAGYKINLTISPFETSYSIPPTVPPAVKDTAEAAARLLQIGVSITWNEQGRPCELKLKSAVGGT